MIADYLQEKQNMKKGLVLFVITVICVITVLFGVSAAADGSGDIDIVLAGGDITMSAIISVPANKTVHITVADGQTATLKCSAGFVNNALFDVAAGGKLILGDGSVTYGGNDLTAAA